VRALTPQISEPKKKENNIIRTCEEEECVVSTQETAVRREWESGTRDLCIGFLTDNCPHLQNANLLALSNECYVFENFRLSTTRLGGSYSVLSRTFHDDGFSRNVVVTEPTYCELKTACIKRHNGCQETYIGYRFPKRAFNTVRGDRVISRIQQPVNMYT
jgi:hypothetical protein